MPDSSILDSIIYGRVEPHIYAFETNTVPNFLKVGDTYRPVEIRLGEWRKIYTNLVKKYEALAKVDEKTYFRDYSVHDFLIANGFRRIEKGDVKQDFYISNEFFKDAKKETVEEAIKDIQQSFEQKDNRYSFYDVDEHLPLGDFDFQRDADWKPRENQQEVIDKFSEAVKSGRKNLLMYAVMRFGKSFTSLCCAKAMQAKLVVIVCGKTAVRSEWKENVQRPKILDGFEFVDSNRMKASPSVVSEKLAEGKTVVVFLTMQDLLGEEIKNKHQDLFNLSESRKLDLLIIDETHFGARAEKYGQTLGYDDSVSDLDDRIKVFKPNVKLHLSGTPYRILLENEFESQDIVGMVQYSDIINAKEKWDKENIDSDEWDNPYYGFPQMIRFAFHLNKSSIKKLENLKNSGYSYDLSELLAPKATSKSNSEHNQFKHKEEVLDLLRAIDGSKMDDNIFSFLNYDKIKNGNMCRHIVMVLPNCASCDAMAVLLREEKFNNLNDYEILNVAGFDAEKSFCKSDYAAKVKERIEKLEGENKKTITLTVGKMMTGCTVKEWDTMIFLRNTASPQDYDQATFRLQSQYIKTIESSDGKKIKCNMKPQTLLVDFDPARMYSLMHRKSLIALINNSERGNEILERNLRRELEIAPIICMNHDKLRQMEATDIVDAIRNYNANKSMLDETFDIEIDYRIFDDDEIKEIISKQPEITDKGINFSLSPFKSEDEGDELDDTLPGDSEQSENSSEEKTKNKQTEISDEKLLSSKLQGYYFKLLLFAFLSENQEKSISDIISSIENNEDGKRIAGHLQINVDDLKVVREKINPQILNYLENKIQNIDELGSENTADKISVALKKMSRLSESEVITPAKVAEIMVENLPGSLNAESRFLDIASKTGEFACALVGKYGGNIKGNIYSIATSGVTYECTRKIYKMLGLPAEHIFSNFTSYDLIDKEHNEKIIEELKNMNFDAIIGNPPYQKESISQKSAKNGQIPRTNIFQNFQLLADEVTFKYVSMIYPAGRWIHRSGKGLAQFGLQQINDIALEKIYYYPNSRELFEDIELDDGISIVCKDKNKKNNGFEYIFHNCGIETHEHLDNPKDELLALNPRNRTIVQKVDNFIKGNNLKYLFDRIMPRSLFGIESTFVEDNSSKVRPYSENQAVNYEKEVKLLVNDKSGSAGRTRWFIVDKNLIEANTKYINEYQVVVSSAHPGGQNGRSNQIEIIDNHSAFGRSRVALASFKREKEAQNFYNYSQTYLVRFMFLMTDEALTSLGKKVPDIMDYTDDNKLLDFSQDLNKQLYKLVGLSPEEVEFIEKNVKTME